LDQVKDPARFPIVRPAEIRRERSDARLRPPPIARQGWWWRW